MENQIPPLLPEQNNANSPAAGTCRRSTRTALGVAPTNVRDRDDSYQRIPDIYRCRLSTAALR